MFQTNPYVRIIAFVIMVASLVGGFWWLTWTLAVLFLVVFPLYYEIIVWGVMYDALYGLPTAQFGGLTCIFTVISILLLILSLVVRKILISHESTI